MSNYKLIQQELLNHAKEQLHVASVHNLGLFCENYDAVISLLSKKLLSDRIILVKNVIDDLDLLLEQEIKSCDRLCEERCEEDHLHHEEDHQEEDDDILTVEDLERFLPKSVEPWSQDVLDSVRELLAAAEQRKQEDRVKNRGVKVKRVPPKDKFDASDVAAALGFKDLAKDLTTAKPKPIFPVEKDGVITKKQRFESKQESVAEKVPAGFSKETDAVREFERNSEGADSGSVDKYLLSSLVGDAYIEVLKKEEELKRAQIKLNTLRDRWLESEYLKEGLKTLFK